MATKKVNIIKIKVNLIKIKYHKSGPYDHDVLTKVAFMGEKD